jgi:hypothetical protein
MRSSAARHDPAVAAELPPGLGRPVDPEVLLIYAANLLHQGSIMAHSRRQWLRRRRPYLPLAIVRRVIRCCVQIDSTSFWARLASINGNITTLPSSCVNSEAGFGQTLLEASFEPKVSVLARPLAAARLTEAMPME